MKWREWFKIMEGELSLSKEYWPSYSSNPIEENRYQAIKMRLMEELELTAPDTPEERAEWVRKMVMGGKSRSSPAAPPEPPTTSSSGQNPSDLPPAK